MSETIGTSMASIGRVREHHNPRNEDCMHNASPAADCSCQRQVKRKPYRVLRVTDPQAERAHNIVAEIHHHGMLVLRQKGRRKRVSVTLGTLYERLVFNEAMRSARAHKAARKGRKMGK